MVKFTRTNDEPKLRIELADAVNSEKNKTASQLRVTPPERGRVGGGGSGTETHLALIMMGYVLVFLVCHSPRVMLNIYEAANIRYVKFYNIED